MPTSRLRLSAAFDSPQIKGFIGEKVIAFVISRLDKNKYTVINDVMVETKKGRVEIINRNLVSWPVCCFWQIDSSTAEQTC